MVLDSCAHPISKESRIPDMSSGWRDDIKSAKISVMTFWHMLG